MIPITILGRVVAIICMFLGLLIVALPVIIIGGNFEKEYRSYIDNKEKAFIDERAKKFEDIDINTTNLSRADRGFCEVYQFLRKVNKKCEREIFVAQDAHIMVKNELNSQERLLQLLYNEKGYAFYPSEIQKSKIFVLHELYGSHVRNLKLKNDLKQSNNNDNNNNNKIVTTPPNNNTNMNMNNSNNIYY